MYYTQQAIEKNLEAEKNKNKMIKKFDNLVQHWILNNLLRCFFSGSDGWRVRPRSVSGERSEGEEVKSVVLMIKVLLWCWVTQRLSQPGTAYRPSTEAFFLLHLFIST